MKNVILTAFFTLMVNVLSSQAILDWVNHLEGSNSSFSEIAYDIIIDEENFVYITGYFDDSIDFDPGVDEAIYTFGEDRTSAFIAKYSPSGDFIWVVPIGSGSGQAQGSALNFDEEGNILCTGWVYSTVDFDPSPTTHNVSAVGAAVSIFVAKYDTEGNYMSAFAVGGNYYSEGKYILSDADNNILLIGNFSDEVDFDPSGAEFNLTAENFFGELFFAKYSETGEFIFAKQLNATPVADNFDHGDFVKEDADGNIFVAGMYGAELDADPDGGELILSGVANDNVFFGKYNADMELIWAKDIEAGEEGTIQCHALTTDADNNLYLTGWYREQIDMDPSAAEYFLEPELEDASDDMFFAKYTNTGELIWAKTMGGEGYDYARNIKLDSEGIICVSGDFYRMVDFDPGVGVAILEDLTDAQDGFLAFYDQNGNYLNASQIKGNIFNETRIFNMEYDNNDNIYITGTFTETSDFDCTENDFEVQSMGGYDVFLTKYDSVIYIPSVAVLEADKTRINIYPNPATNILHFQNDNPDFFSSEIQIFTLDGRCILQTKGVSNLNISSLPAGLYFVRILNAFYQFEKM